MANTISTNQPTQTSTYSLSVPLIDWGSQYKQTESTPTRVKYTSIVTPLDAATDVIFDYRTIKNVYQNSPVAGLNQPINTFGAEFHTQRNEIWTETSTSLEASTQILHPISGQLKVKYPMSSLITEEMILDFILRLLSGLFDDDTLSRLAALMRGALRFNCGCSSATQ